MPLKTSTHSNPSVTKSTEIFSVAKATTATTNRPMTIQASMRGGLKRSRRMPSRESSLAKKMI